MKKRQANYEQIYSLKESISKTQENIEKYFKENYLSKEVYQSVLNDLAENLKKECKLESSMYKQISKIALLYSIDIVNYKARVLVKWAEMYDSSTHKHIKIIENNKLKSINIYQISDVNKLKEILVYYENIFNVMKNSFEKYKKLKNKYSKT